jgi:hypothetical protein
MPSATIGTALFTNGRKPGRLCRSHWREVNIPDRQLEVYTPGATAPVILAETDTVELVIAGQTVGRIPVAGLLPRPPAEATK